MGGSLHRCSGVFSVRFPPSPRPPCILITWSHIVESEPECNRNAILFAFGFHSGTDSWCSICMLNNFVQFVIKIRFQFGMDSVCTRCAYRMHSECTPNPNRMLTDVLNAYRIKSECIPNGFRMYHILNTW